MTTDKKPIITITRDRVANCYVADLRQIDTGWIHELFGTASLPLPFSADADPVVVASTFAASDYGQQARVVLDLNPRA